ncbi:MAG: gliding motility-associated C-terminal domain-containing protein [Bacteroidales bacterium]|jgi:gliding motility-associated-like protein|nr:gliding motility-associated C-terminal domain-containing protein [Bacteroidales bacterium]
MKKTGTALFFILLCYYVVNANVALPDIYQDTLDSIAAGQSPDSNCITVEKMRKNGYKDTVVCGALSAWFLNLPFPHVKDTVIFMTYSFSDQDSRSWEITPNILMHFYHFTPDTYSYIIHYPSGVCPDIIDTFIIDTFPTVHYPLLPADTLLCPLDTLHIVFQEPGERGYYIWEDLLSIGDSTASILEREFINDSFKLHDFVYVYPLTYFYECMGYSGEINDAMQMHKPEVKQYVIRDTLNIYYAVKPAFSLMNDTVICRDSGFVLEALNINYLPKRYEYNWKCPSSEKEEESFYTADSGWYFLTVSIEQCNLFTTDSVYLEYVPLWWTDINLPPDTFLCDRTSIILDLATGHDSTLYLWLRPSDTALAFDTVSIKSILEFTEKNIGTYTIILQDEKSCRNEQEIAITNDPCLPVFEAPNIITPNGDGVNDLWKIKTADYIYDFAISIYDRRGVIVYKYKGKYEDFSWDGTYFSNGRAVPEGPYFYVVTFKTAQGKNKTEAGSITILR